MLLKLNGNIIHLFNNNNLGYNLSMRKVILLIVLLLSCSYCLADSSELSKQATAFYSDNNQVRTMDLILQINEKDRTGQDWLLLGNVMADSLRMEDAVYMYQKAIEKDKKCYRAYYNLGNYYFERGENDKALENYTKASKISNENPYIYYNMGCVNIKQSNWSKAKNNFNKAIMFNSKVPEFHYNLAYVYKQLKKDKMAQTYLDNYNKLVENQ